MPLGLTSEPNNAPSEVSIARFKESIKVITCGSAQTFVATDGMDVAVGVETGIAVAGSGTGEGVSVVIKANVAGASGVGVGNVETEKSHPVNRNSPISRIDISLLFITVSSLSPLTIISPVI